MVLRVKLNKRDYPTKWYFEQ